MTKTITRTTDELTEALNSAERGDIIDAIAAEPQNNDLDGIGLDILCVHEGKFSYFIYDASLNSEDAEGKDEDVLEAYKNICDEAQMELDNLAAAREEDKISGRFA